MAENESLDLGNRQSFRWRQLRDSIANVEPDEAVVRLLVENLYRMSKKVVGQIPLKALLEAVAAGSDTREILRECRNHEYAQLVVMQAQPGMNAHEVMGQAMWATVDRFLDQICFAVVGGPNWPDIHRFREACSSWKREAFDRVLELAARVASDPSTPPRMPSRTEEQQKEDFAHLTSMSLLPPGGAI